MSGQLWHIWRETVKGGFTKHEKWEGDEAKKLAAFTLNGTLGLAYIGTNDHLYVKCQPGWSECPLAGPTANNWTAATAEATDIAVGMNVAEATAELFYVGTNTDLYFNAGPRFDNESHFGGWGQRIAVGQDRRGALHVFYIGTDDRIYHSWQQVETDVWKGQEWWRLAGWSPQLWLPGDQGATRTVREIAVGQNADGRLEVFVVQP